MNNRFVFVMPAYNASETVARSILSVWFQTYPNWKILIRDDVSTDNTLEIVKQLKKDLGCSDDKIQIKRNDEKNWEVKNILEMLEETDSNDIILQSEVCKLCVPNLTPNPLPVTLLVDRIWALIKVPCKCITRRERRHNMFDDSREEP